MRVRHFPAQSTGLRLQPIPFACFPPPTPPALPPSAASSAPCAPKGSGCSHAPGPALTAAPPTTSCPPKPRSRIPPRSTQEHTHARNRQPRPPIPAPTRVMPARRAVAGARKARRIDKRFLQMDRIPIPRLVVPTQPTAPPQNHMARKMRHPNRVQDQKMLLVRKKPRTRATLPLTPTDPTVPRHAAAAVCEQPTIRPARSRTSCPRLSPTGVEKPQ